MAAVCARTSAPRSSIALISLEVSPVSRSRITSAALGWNGPGEFLINANTTDSSTPDLASVTTSGMAPEKAGAAPAGKAVTVVWVVLVWVVVVVVSPARTERLEVARAPQRASNGTTRAFEEIL